MGKGQLFGFTDFVFVKKEIEIDGSGTPAGVSNAAEFFFDREEAEHQTFRIEIGFDGDGSVEKSWLIGDADRFGFVKRGGAIRLMDAVSSRSFRARERFWRRSPRLEPMAMIAWRRGFIGFACGGFQRRRRPVPRRRVGAVL